MPRTVVIIRTGQVHGKNPLYKVSTRSRLCPQVHLLLDGHRCTWTLAGDTDRYNQLSCAVDLQLYERKDKEMKWKFIDVMELAYSYSFIAG